MPASSRRRDIQGLRAVAVLMVVVFHAGLPVPGGFTGVDVFFVISGFVITRLLLAELSDSGRLSFRTFYTRRARRLLPALSIVTLFTVIAAVVLEPPMATQETAGAMASATSLFVGNIEAWRQPSGYFGTGSITNPLLHMWSLGVEEQFYLFFPSILLLTVAAARRTKLSSRRFTAILLILAGALSLELCGLATTHHPQLAFFWIPFRAWEFAAGSLLACAEPRLVASTPKALGPVLGIAGAGIIVFSAFAVSSVGFPGWHALLPVAGAALVLAGGTVGDGPVSWLLARRPVTRLGDMSYSWYLWHWPLIVLARAAIPDSRWPAYVAAAVSLVPAWISLRFIEEPVRRGTMLARRTVALALTCVLVPCLAGGALLALAHQGWGSARNRAFRVESATNAIADNEHCLLGGVVLHSAIGACRFDVSKSRGVVALVGDSHAAALSNAVVTSGTDDDYDVQVDTASACPFTDLARSQDQETLNCGQVFTWTMKALIAERARLRLVVISQADAGHVTTLADDGTTHPLHAWIHSLHAALSTLTEAHIPVLLVLDVPRITAQPEPCRFGVIFSLDCAVPRSWVNEVQGPTWRAESRIAAGIPGVHALSLVSKFCTARSCDAVQDGRLMYYDNQHLDSSGSEYVEPQVRSAMQAALDRG